MQHFTESATFYAAYDRFLNVVDSWPEFANRVPCILLVRRRDSRSRMHDQRYSRGLGFIDSSSTCPHVPGKTSVGTRCTGLAISLPAARLRPCTQAGPTSPGALCRSGRGDGTSLLGWTSLIFCRPPSWAKASRVLPSDAETSQGMSPWRLQSGHPVNGRHGTGWRSTLSIRPRRFCLEAGEIDLG